MDLRSSTTRGEMVRLLYLGENPLTYGLAVYLPIPAETLISWLTICSTDCQITLSPSRTRYLCYDWKLHYL